ncbi:MULTISPECIES: hypothetical protein [unclassified Viridibacillus]|uniref:hypothetical protein n=2 Tax=Caryophanaceae TaxID=186818 RepID=UPI00117D6B9D|nr:hypothetical protein [Viridibacillus sp. FSL H7-0596]
MNEEIIYKYCSGITKSYKDVIPGAIMLISLSVVSNKPFASTSSSSLLISGINEKEILEYIGCIKPNTHWRKTNPIIIPMSDPISKELISSLGDVVSIVQELILSLLAN